MVRPRSRACAWRCPGLLTSAYLALKLYDSAVDTVVMPFDEIQEAVKRGDVAAGLLIHEGQLTYRDEGLRKIVDLGEWWAERTDGLPLPLGGNVIRRDLGPDLIARVSRLLHASIKHALDHRQQALEYAMQFGRGLDPAKVDRFVGMYVNNLTLGYTDESRRAVQLFLDEAHEKGIIPSRVTVEFAMNRRDFLIGAASGASSAIVFGVAGKALTGPGGATADAPLPEVPPLPPPTPALYQGRRSFAQQGEDLILYNLLCHDLKIQAPTYLDIGAGDPVLCNNTYALYLTGSRGVLVEPNPMLVREAQGGPPRRRCHGCGVGLKETTAADYFVIRGHWPLNTFSPEAVAEIRKQSAADPVEKRDQDAAHPDQPLIDDHFGSAPDLLSIDIEGLDLAVLRTMDFARTGPRPSAPRRRSRACPTTARPSRGSSAARATWPARGRSTTRSSSTGRGSDRALTRDGSCHRLPPSRRVVRLQTGSDPGAHHRGLTPWSARAKARAVRTTRGPGTTSSPP